MKSGRQSAADRKSGRFLFVKDFKSYREEDGARRAAQNAADRTAGQGAAGGEGQKTPDGKPAESEAAELARKALAAYNGRSEGAVLAEIVKQAEAMKRAGTLSNDELDAFYRQFSPLLEGMQQKKLRSVIERLKRI